MSTIMVELIIKMKNQIHFFQCRKTNEKTNGFISPQMSNFHTQSVKTVHLLATYHHINDMCTPEETLAYQGDQAVAWHECKSTCANSAGIHCILLPFGSNCPLPQSH